MSRAGAIRLFWIGAAATLVVAALLALFAVLGGQFDSTDWKILDALGTLLLGGAAGTVGVSLRDTNRSAAFGTALAYGAPVLALICLAALAEGYKSNGLAKLAGIAYVLLTAGLVVGTARVLMRRRNQLLPFAVVVGTASLAAFLGILAIATENGGDWKAIVATLIVMALAYALIPVWRRMAEPAAATSDAQVELLDLALGVEHSGVHVRLARSAMTLPSETIVVTAGRAVAGSSSVAAGQAVRAPAGTSLELTSDGGAILIGR